MVTDRLEILQRIERGDKASDIWLEIEPSMFGLDCFHFLYGAASAYRAAGSMQKSTELGILLNTFLKRDSECATSKTGTENCVVQVSTLATTPLSSSVEMIKKVKPFVWLGVMLQTFFTR